MEAFAEPSNGTSDSLATFWICAFMLLLLSRSMQERETLLMDPTGFRTYLLQMWIFALAIEALSQHCYEGPGFSRL